jgi:hypothetical protein
VIREIQVGIERPHLLHLWEPLRTKAPCPDKARPYCCLYKTVIFYVGPRYIIRPWSKRYKWSDGWHVERKNTGLEEWGRVEYDLTFDDTFDWCEERFIVGGGRVIWKLSQWWMKHWARRARCRLCETIIHANGYSATYCSQKCAMWRPGSLMERPRIAGA